MNIKLLAAAGCTLAVLGAGTVGEARCTPRPPVVTIAYDNHRRIDVSPPQRLDVLYTRGHVPQRYAAAWGGDASLAWATEDCLDMGGDPHWQGGRVLRCQGVDY